MTDLEYKLTVSLIEKYRKNTLYYLDRVSHATTGSEAAVLLELADQECREAEKLRLTLVPASR